MIKHSMKLAACISFFGVAVLSENAMAMSQHACELLPGNMFLAAVERGDCDIDIQTAAGPDEELIPEEGGDRDRPNRDGRNGGDRGGNSGGKTSGGRQGGRI